MGSTLTSVTIWRRLLLIGITALIALLAVSFTAPDDAHAFADPTVVTSSYTGWVTVRSGPITCGGGNRYVCTRGNATAWRWDGSSWSQTSLVGGTQVYAYPYSGSWHWVWTQRTGWLAIQTSWLQKPAPKCGIGYAVPCPLY